MPRIRDRSDAEQILYEKLLPRLCSGESAAKLSRETGLPAATLRAWKTRAKKRNAGQPHNSAAATPATVETAAPAAVTAEKLREFLLNQGEIAAPLLAAFNEKIQEGLEQAHGALMTAFKVLHARLAEETKEVVMHDEGSSYIGHIKKNSADLAHEVKALGQLSEQLAAFFCIPYGALKTESIRFAPSAVSNHLHLHSHGGKGGKPVKALPVAQLAPIDVTPSSADRMSSAQVEMVEALED